MNCNTQNAKIAPITEKTLIVGIDVGSVTHYARACCDKLLSQFFQEGNSENLTEKQKEVLGIWNNLSTNEQETVRSMLRGLRK